MRDAAGAERLGPVDVVLPRAGFGGAWRGSARGPATAQAREMKKLATRARTPEEAAAAFARQWVADEHWEAAERVMSRDK
ncbi:hypothetical protein ACIBVL_08805 [Streptomyces sp. NPDC049687]|uniref:hypothetical protein n=1 Tax=Streptomyces sp. NPDC049687 TaxID=3365596 RepID=UPI00379F75FC